MQGLQTRQAQGLSASQWAPLPTQKGLPNLFQPQHGPLPPFSCLPSSHSWEGWGEKRPQGAGKMWAAEPGVLCGVDLNWCTPSPAPTPASCPSQCQAAQTCLSACAPRPLSLSVPDLHLAAGRTRPQGPRAEQLPEDSCHVRRSHSHSRWAEQASVLRKGYPKADRHTLTHLLSHTPSHTHSHTGSHAGRAAIGPAGCLVMEESRSRTLEGHKCSFCPRDRQPLGRRNHLRLWNHGRRWRPWLHPLTVL